MSGLQSWFICFFKICSCASRLDNLVLRACMCVEISCKIALRKKKRFSVGYERSVGQIRRRMMKSEPLRDDVFSSAYVFKKGYVAGVFYFY